MPPVVGKGDIGLMDLARAFFHASKGRKICLTSRPLGWPLNANEITHPHGFWGIRVAVASVLEHPLR